MPAGYADGLDRRLAGNGSMLVRGRRVPIVGSVCMDMTMIDVTGLDVAPGDEVVIIGEQEGESIGVREMAAAIGTIPYELLCRVGTRIERRVRGARSQVTRCVARRPTMPGTLDLGNRDPRSANVGTRSSTLGTMKPKVVYVCQECGAQSPKWLGRCTECGAWNSLVEERPVPAAAGRRRGGGQRGRAVLTGVHGGAAAVRRN